MMNKNDLKAAIWSEFRVYAELTTKRLRPSDVLRDLTALAWKIVAIAVIKVPKS